MASPAYRAKIKKERELAQRLGSEKRTRPSCRAFLREAVWFGKELNLLRPLVEPPGSPWPPHGSSQEDVLEGFSVTKLKPSLGVQWRSYSRSHKSKGIDNTYHTAKESLSKVKCPQTSPRGKISPRGDMGPRGEMSSMGETDSKDDWIHSVTINRYTI